MSGLDAGLVELIHHVELTDSEWWQRASENAVLGVLWLADAPLDATSLQRELSELGHSVGVSRCEEAGTKLVGEGLVLEEAGGYQLSEVGRQRIQELVDTGEQVGERARRLFNESLEQHCSGDIDLDTAWEVFNETLLFPLVRDLGVATYELLRGKDFSFDPARYLDPYLDKYGDVERTELLAAVSGFLNPRSDAIRRYVLRQLVATFVIRASGLDDETLKRITEATRSKAVFSCFTDTNVLFSALDLHDNPANEVAQELFALKEAHKDRLDVDFQVLPITLEEAKRALDKAEEHCRGLVLGSKTASVAARVPMGGLTARFVRQARAGGVRDAREYFGTFRDNLLAVCRDHGVELHNADLDGHKVREDVATDILDHLDFERKRRQRPKSYEQVEHDIVLWHYARERRNPYIESPVEAKYWIVTLDYRLIGYDGHRSRRSDAIPICIDPSALLQLLQFWVPRGPELERAFLASIRAGFLFQEFDPAAERAVLRILKALSRFEQAEDLGEETISSIVLNRELRRRMSLIDDPDEQVALVREELIEIEKGLRERVSALEEEVAVVEGRSQSTAASLALTTAELEGARSAAADWAQAALESENERSREQTVAEKLETTNLRYFFALTALLGVFIVLASSWLVGRLNPDAVRAVSVVLGGGTFVGWLYVGRRKVRTSSSRTAHSFQWVESSFSWVAAAAIGVLTGVLGNFLYAWIT